MTRWLVLLGLFGCVGTASSVVETDRFGEDPPGEDPPVVPMDPLGPGGYSLVLDTSSTDPYGRLESTDLPITGEARASLGLDRVEAGDPPTTVPTAADGSFTATAVVEPGLNLVELRAHDIEGHSVSGHRSLLRSAYVPEGERNRGAAVIALNDEILSGLAGSVGDLLGGDIDLASELPPGSELINDDMCQLYVNRVSHGELQISASVLEDGRLDLTVILPDVAVGFQGQCNAIGQTVTVRPNSEADQITVEVHVPLRALPPAPGECVTRFEADDVTVELTSFDLDLRLSGGSGLIGTIIGLGGEIIGELVEGSIADKMEGQLQPMVNDLIGPFLDMDINILDVTEEMAFFDVPMEVALCLTGLEPVDGVLMATVGASVTGPGGGPTAPGAPHLPPTAPAAAPGTLYLDPGLVGQLLHGAWGGGALQIDDLTADADESASAFLNVGALAILARELRTLYTPGTFDDATPLEIDIDAELAPISWAAAPPVEGSELEVDPDVFIGLGELKLTIRAGGETLFVFGTHIEMGLSLEGGEGEVVPVYVSEASTTHVWLLESPRVELGPASVRGLEGALKGIVGSQISGLLDGLAITLPDLGVPLSVSEVVADGSGYLSFTLGGTEEELPPAE